MYHGLQQLLQVPDYESNVSTIESMLLTQNNRVDAPLNRRWTTYLSGKVQSFKNIKTCLV